MEIETLKEITEKPKFEPKLPPFAFLRDEDRTLAEAMSVLDQKGEWSMELQIKTWNLVVRNHNEKERWKATPFRVLIFIIGIFLTAFAGAYVEKRMNTDAGEKTPKISQTNER